MFSSIAHGVPRLSTRYVANIPGPASSFMAIAHGRTGAAMVCRVRARLRGPPIHCMATYYLHRQDAHFSETRRVRAYLGTVLRNPKQAFVGSSWKVLDLHGRVYSDTWTSKVGCNFCDTTIEVIRAANESYANPENGSHVGL